MALKQMFSDKLTDVSTTAVNEIGILRIEGKKGYRYFQVASTATASVVNGSVMLAATTDGIVTDDVSESGGFNMLRGVAISTVPVSSYAWFQVLGNHSAVKTNGDDDIALGDFIIADTTDGVCDSVAAGTAPTYRIIGIASAANSNTNNTVAVDLLIG